MKRLLLLSVIFLSGVILSSCAVTVKVPVQQKNTTEWNGTWVGKSYSQIADRFGVPEIVVKDGNDGEVLIYDGVSSNGSKGDCSARFFLGSDGVCTRVVAGTSLSSSERISQTEAYYDTSWSEDAPRSRSKWAFLLDDAFNILILLSVIILAC